MFPTIFLVQHFSTVGKCWDSVIEMARRKKMVLDFSKMAKERNIAGSTLVVAELVRETELLKRLLKKERWPREKVTAADFDL